MERAETVFVSKFHETPKVLKLFKNIVKNQRNVGGFFRVFGGPWGVLGESLWSLERPRGVFGAPLERPRSRNDYRTLGISMIFKPVLFTFVPSLGGAGRSLERLWGVFGSPLVPIGKFWVEKDGSGELPGAPTSSSELRGRAFGGRCAGCEGV